MSLRKCGWKVCGKRNPKEDMVICNSMAFCDYDHATKYGIEASNKLRAVKAKQESVRRKREYKEKNHAHQFSLTKKMAQKLANRLDANLPCICCDRPRKPGVVFCGGHFKTGKAHSELALDLRNIHGQENVNCNMHLSGNINGTKNTKGFKAGLVERYGQQFVDYLESYHPPKKWTCEELIELRALYAAEIRNLGKGLPPSRNWRALPEQMETI